MSDVKSASNPETVTTGGQPIPRISLHAFMEAAIDRENLAVACRDRRMVRVTNEIREGSVATASEFYTEQPTPNLLIVDVPQDRVAAFAHLQTLAEACDPGTQVVVIGTLNDVNAYRDFMRQGISEYLVSPVSAVQFIETIANIYSNPAAQPLGKVHCVTGVNGGVGASTVAHNVAWHLAETLHESTVIIDLDLAFGTLGLDFNYEGGKGITEALLEPDRLDDVLLERLLYKATDKLHLFTSPCTLESGFDPAPKALEKVMDVVKANFAHVVIDLPHSWAPWARGLLMAADEIVLCMTPDLASLRNAKNLNDYLVAQRPNDSAPRLVVNMTEAPKRPEIPMKELIDAVGTTPSCILTYDNLLFGTAANNGQMVSEVDSKNKNALALLDLASQLARRGASMAASTKDKSPLAPLLALLKGRKA
jgi:pilus assembly protein CpaE